MHVQCNFIVSFIFFLYQLSATIIGLLSGPVLGLFLVGATLPFVSGVVSVLQRQYSSRKSSWLYIQLLFTYRTPSWPPSFQLPSSPSLVSAMFSLVTTGQCCQELMRIARHSSMLLLTTGPRRPHQCTSTLLQLHPCSTLHKAQRNQY